MIRIACCLMLALWLSPVGDGGSLAAEEVMPVSTVLFGSCIQQKDPVPILETMAARSPQVVLFVGDNIYADTDDMNVMRAKYDRLASDPGIRQLRRNATVLATWDDHDYGVNDAGADFGRRRESQQEFFRFWGEPSDTRQRPLKGVYDARLFGPAGKRLQIILLDTRFFRSPLKKGERRVGGPYVPDPDRSKTMLGEEQWRWLESELRRPAEIRLLVSSIQLVADAAGQETWSNLPAERDRLLRLIRETRADGVIVLSGDRHWAELSRENVGAGYPLYDLTSSSLNQKHPRGTPTDNGKRFLANTYHEENFGELRIDWEKDDPVITMRILSGDATTRLMHQIRRSELVMRESEDPGGDDRARSENAVR